MRTYLKCGVAAALLWLLPLQAFAQAQGPAPASAPPTSEWSPDKPRKPKREPAEPSKAVEASEAVERPWWVAAELHLSVLSNLVDRSTANITFGYGANFGYRWSNGWGAYVHVEHNLWTETELEMNVKQGAFDVGFGGERLYFHRRMRAALAVGPAVMLYDTALDAAGTTGLFIDVRPTAVRWPVGKGFVVVLDPLTFTLVAPALGGIPLVQIQYRTALAVEYDL